MAADSTVAGSHVADLLRALGACGVDAVALCRAIGWQANDLSGDARVPAAVVAALFEQAARASRDPQIGLHAARHATPRGPLLYLMLASSDLDAILRSWEQFSRIPISSLRVRLAPADDAVAMTFDFADPLLDAEPRLAEYLLLTVLRPIRQAVTGELRPRAVCFRHAARGDVAEYARAFDCPVRFGEAQHALVFDRRDLGRPCRLANPVVARELAAMSAAVDGGIDTPPTWRERVAEATRSLLVTGERPDRATVARQLGTSEPSLHRALRDEHTTFKEVRDGVVWTVARTLLAAADVKIEAIALTVGFADGASFAKAFKRHAGVSPRVYRESGAACRHA